MDIIADVVAFISGIPHPFSTQTALVGISKARGLIDKTPINHSCENLEAHINSKCCIGMNKTLQVSFLFQKIINFDYDGFFCFFLKFKWDIGKNQ